MPQAQRLMERGKAIIQPARTISKVGIIGAGQMGTGIAHVVALSGYEVALNDLKKETYEKGLETVGGNMARQVAKGVIKESDRDRALERISFAPDLEAFGDCDLVIESATEDEALKHKIFAALCPHLKPTALLASNTSSISITRLAATTDRPEDFIGMHFMNPVPLMELVELIRGIATEDETFATAKIFVESLGKTTAISEDFPAFIVNRILLPMINEAVYTLYEGVGTVEADRQGNEARRASSDGASRACRFHRARHMFERHAGALRRAFGFEVPAVSAARQIRRGRLAWP